MIKNSYYILPTRGLIITSLIFVLWLCITSTLRAQILTNSDFESNDEPGHRVAWVVGKDKLPISLGEGADGKGKSLMLKSTDGTHFFQLAPLYPDALGQYELSFRVKTEGLQEKTVGFVWVNLLDADSTMLFETGWGRYEGTKDWTSYTYTFFVPSNTTFIKVGGSITGEGTLWFDDFELKEIHFNSDKIVLSASADQYINAVLDTIRKYAVNRHLINFDDIHQIIRYKAQGAIKPSDSYQAIKSGVRYLIDNHHSNFFTPEEIKKVFGDINIQELLGDAYIQDPGMNLDSLKATINFSKGKLIENRIGYLSIPQFTNAYLEGTVMFGDSLQRLIKLFDQRELQGWIIDLRNNGGGATPPMVLGIGPLLKKGNKAYYTNATHKPESEFYYRNGSYYEHGMNEKTVQPSLNSTVNYKVENSTLPIAVLIGSGTSSAGEGVATILAGEPNVKMFGDKTAGYTTVNEFIVFPDDAVLNLSTGYLATKDMEVYEKEISPDILIKDNGSQDSSEDVVLQKALDWINSN